VVILYIVSGAHYFFLSPLSCLPSWGCAGGSRSALWLTSIEQLLVLHSELNTLITGVTSPLTGPNPAFLVVSELLG